MAEYPKVRTLLEASGEGLSALSVNVPTTWRFFISCPVDILDEEKFNVELIVQCIRVSEMPQTHHHALLLLGTVAGIFPVSVNDFKAYADILGVFFRGHT